MNIPELNPFKLLKRAWQKWILAVLVIYLFLEDSVHDKQRAFFVTLLVYAALFVLAELLRPKPEIEEAKPFGLGDFNIPTATEGRKVPLLFGRVLLKGPNVIWYGDPGQSAITRKVKTGIFSSRRETIGFRYFIAMQFAFARGPDVVLKKIFIGDVEAFSGTIASGQILSIDKPNLFGGGEVGDGGIQTTCTFYGGSDIQAVDAFLNATSRQQITSPNRVTAPRYTGTSHLVCHNLTSLPPQPGDSGAYIGNSTSIAAWSFELERFPVLFSGQSSGDNVFTDTDCNPINVIYEVLTNSEWGFGHDAADIDIGPSSTFKNASDRLIEEGNGFSMILDKEIKATKLLSEIQRQIDGILYLDQRTGKWKIQLVRGADDPLFGFNIDTVPQFTDASVKSVPDFTRGSWEDTTNQITVKFNKREDEYKESCAPAQDMANALIQGGGTVLTTLPIQAEVNYPGVKTAELAVNLAWRDLRVQSFPLARATFTVDRRFWDLILGGVIAWTNAKLGLTKLPMRVTKIDYGKLEDNKMVVTTVQDVFLFAPASFGAPTPTGWTIPAITLVAFPPSQQTAFESPRALLLRDPESEGIDTISRIHAAARMQGSELSIKIKQRNAAGVPSGAFFDAGIVFGFTRIGQLKNALSTGTAVPTATITLVSTPDSQNDLESIFDDGTTPQELGIDLAQLVKVGNEFMLVQKAANGSGSDVDLQTVYRGVLDSVQQDHTAGTEVFLLFAGAGITETPFPNTNRVDIELRSRSSTREFTGPVTRIDLTMDKRAMRPYPPSEVSIDGTRYSASVSLEGSGAGLDGLRNDFTWLRRNFTTGNEVEALTDDAPGLDSSTEYQVELRADPDTADNLIGTTSWVPDSSPALQFLRKLILHYSPNGAAGTEIRCIIRTRHDYKTETNLAARQTLIYDFTPTSALTSQFAFGSLAATTISAVYTTVATGTFTLSIGTAFSSSNVQARINGGSWNTIIAASATTGTIAGVTSSDTIEIRHTANDSGARTFVELKNPSSAAVAYGVLHAGQAAS